jgi:hypothetical protein
MKKAEDIVEEYCRKEFSKKEWADLQEHAESFRKLYLQEVSHLREVKKIINSSKLHGINLKNKGLEEQRVALHKRAEAWNTEEELADIAIYEINSRWNKFTKGN